MVNVDPSTKKWVSPQLTRTPVDAGAGGDCFFSAYIRGAKREYDMKTLRKEVASSMNGVRKPKVKVLKYIRFLRQLHKDVYEVTKNLHKDLEKASPAESEAINQEIKLQNELRRQMPDPGSIFSNNENINLKAIQLFEKVAETVARPGCTADQFVIQMTSEYLKETNQPCFVILRAPKDLRKTSIADTFCEGNKSEQFVILYHLGGGRGDSYGDHYQYMQFDFKPAPGGARGGETAAKKTKAELYRQARAQKVPGRSKMNKTELAFALGKK